MIVIDANVAVMALASPAAQGDAARAALYADDAWVAPAHMPLEVLRTLHKAVAADRLTIADADASVQMLLAMQIEYIGTDVVLLQAVWGMRHNISVYDAAYLAVAAMHDSPLLTFDERLAHAASRVKPDVRVRRL
ncbi:MAG: type II toxin-antitoxin system VapC family toxin [Mycobacterium sp.]|uniref:type II toxin-antitoxin system VapC family toxin n=1 Tax=Mycobacterium sp. TaxID=1785 RepID=UPI001EBCBE52|nr:type II toxin-antitoxin system VapC family toxin [Mycobacterium sp.]MBW0017617.1 type II toxin-antitoxin system VapC family toxin [Mycobacterium sp.]